MPKARNPSQRGVDSESRQNKTAKRRLSAQEKADTISDFTALEKHCRSIDNMLFTKEVNYLETKGVVYFDSVNIFEI